MRRSAAGSRARCRQSLGFRLRRSARRRHGAGSSRRREPRCGSPPPIGTGAWRCRRCSTRWRRAAFGGCWSKVAPRCSRRSCRQAWRSAPRSRLRRCGSGRRPRPACASWASVTGCRRCGSSGVEVTRLGQNVLVRGDIVYPLRSAVNAVPRAVVHRARAGRGAEPRRERRARSPGKCGCGRWLPASAKAPSCCCTAAKGRHPSILRSTRPARQRIRAVTATRGLGKWWSRRVTRKRWARAFSRSRRTATSIASTPRRCGALPSTLPAERAVLAANMETAVNVVWDAGIGLGDDVVVMGGGVVGLLAGYAARKSGASRVRLLEPSARRRQAALALGFSAASPPADAVGPGRGRRDRSQRQSGVPRSGAALRCATKASSSWRRSTDSAWRPWRSGPTFIAAA